MAKITLTTSLYFFLKYQRVGEPDAVIKIPHNREHPSQFGCGAMNEDRKHVGRKKPILTDMPEVTTLQPC